jgi:exosome complex RNA-binding protein Rrp42 (RNase PH superfamily)
MTSSLSAAERRFLVDGVAHDVRNDARASGTFRRAFVETGIFESCAGSARVRVGLADVSVGVKLRVVATKSDAPDEGFLECAVDAAFAKLDNSAADADLAQALFRSYAQVRNISIL